MNPRRLNHYIKMIFLGLPHCQGKYQAIEIRIKIPILAISINMGNMVLMKTTLDIHDELLVRAKRYAKEAGKPLRAVVEEGLRNILSSSTSRSQYILPDLRVGNSNADDPLEQYSWPELRDSIYGDSDT